MTNKKNNVTVEQKERGTNMEQTQQNYEFWNKTYFQLVLEHFKANQSKEFAITARNYFDKEFYNKEGKKVHIDGVQKVLNFLFKKGALKIGEVKIVPSSDFTREEYKIVIKDFDINCKATSKAGNEYEIFKRFINF